jgi:hypothetical protein
MLVEMKVRLYGAAVSGKEPAHERHRPPFEGTVLGPGAHDLVRRSPQEDRMRRIPAALVALTVAAALVVLAVPASAAGPRSFKAFSKTVRAGQQVKVLGKGCRAQGFVRIYLNGVEFDTDRADRRGQFVDHVEIPGSADPGRHRIKAGCNGFALGSVEITVLASRFTVQPRNVEAGDSITVSGSRCRPGSYVTIKLGARLIGDGRVNGRGRFRVRATIPGGTSEDAHRVSARCHGRFVGVQIIVIIIVYPSPQSLLTTDRTAVPAGQAVTLSGTSCPTGRPMASLDGQPVDLNVDRGANGDGFTASVTIPSTATPGTHTLRAGCEAGSSGTTELHVLNAAEGSAGG